MKHLNMHLNIRRFIWLIVAVIIAAGLLLPDILIKRQSDSYMDRTFTSDIDSSSLSTLAFYDDYENFIGRIINVVTVWDFYNDDIPQYTRTFLDHDEDLGDYDEDLGSAAHIVTDHVKSFSAYGMVEFDEVAICMPSDKSLPELWRDDAEMFEMYNFVQSDIEERLEFKCGVWFDLEINCVAYMSIEHMYGHPVLNYASLLYQSERHYDYSSDMILQFANRNGILLDGLIPMATEIPTALSPGVEAEDGAESVNASTLYNKLDITSDGNVVLTYYTHIADEELCIFMRLVGDIASQRIIKTEIGFTIPSQL